MEIKIEAESSKEKKAPDEWEIKCWADKIIEAEEIKADAEKMALVKPFLDKKVKAIKSLDDLRMIAAQKSKEE